MEFRQIWVIALLVGLFAFGLISAIISMQTYNNSQVNINNNPMMMKMFGNISNQLTSSNNQADSAKQAFVQETQNPTVTSLGFVFNSILSAGNTFMSMGIGMFSSIFVFASDIFGINPIITGTFMALLIGVLILAIWSLVRAGR